MHNQQTWALGHHCITSKYSVTVYTEPIQKWMHNTVCVSVCVGFLLAGCVLTSLIILTASLVRPSFLEHMASLLFIYTNTLVSLPAKTELSSIRSRLPSFLLKCNRGWDGPGLPFLLSLDYYWLRKSVKAWITLTVLGFILCTMMLELLAAAVAALSSF